MRARLLSAGFVVSLLMLVSGCGQDTNQSTEPASKGSEVTKPALNKPEVTEPEIVKPKTTERKVEEAEEAGPKPPPTLK